jgi:hypothetical protein
MMVDDACGPGGPMSRHAWTGRRPAVARRVLRCAMFAAVVVFAAAEAQAHAPGQSYLYLRLRSDAVSGRFEIALADFNRALALTGTDREITAQNLDERFGILQEYYRRHVTILAGAKSLPIRFTTHGFLNTRGGYALLSFDLAGLERAPEVLTIDYSVLFDDDPGHRGFLLVEYNWATGTFANEGRTSLVFSLSARRQDFNLTTSGRLRGFLAVVRLGVEHIWMGFDHVMFLVALLLPAVLRREGGQWAGIDRFGPALMNVLKIVTAFTIAHSVTLSLAALGHVRLPERLVEVAIAGSIAFAAADILYPLFRGRVWLAVFGFGLFHGFGFAGALSEMGVLGEHLGLALFGFNLGVEIGQIVIVAILFPLLFLVRAMVLYRRVALPVAAVGMILVSSAWVIERALGIHTPLLKLVRPVVMKVIS